LIAAYFLGHPVFYYGTLVPRMSNVKVARCSAFRKSFRTAHPVSFFLRRKRIVTCFF